MPYLGDFLGHILAELTISRMQADLESLRIADFYASHPLLRTMPVPRFRLPQVDIDVPVVIDRAEEQTEGGTPRGTVSLADLGATLDKVLTVDLKKRGIRIPSEGVRRIERAAETHIEALRAEPTEITVDTQRIAHDLAGIAARELGEASEEDEREAVVDRAKVEETLETAIRNELMRKRTPPPRLLVRVATDQVREAGPMERIGHIRLTVSEEHLEWTVIESEEGEKRQRLVPE